MKEGLLIKEEKLNINEMQSFIRKYIKENATLDNDTLFHFEYNYLKKNLMIYSIKKGVMVEQISKKVKYLSVLPIQFIIHKIIMKKLKSIKSYAAFVVVDDYVYKLNVKDGVIIEALCEEFNDKAVEGYIKEADSNDIVIMDEELNKKMSNKDMKLNNIKFIDFGGYNALY